MKEADCAGEVRRLFPAIYLALHARRASRGKAGELLTPQSWAVLSHLAMAGPLTIGEAAEHLERAQSVVSEIVAGLERKKLVSRIKDARDKRRALVWLTDEGFVALERSQEVLAPERVLAAVSAMAPLERQKLIAGMRALVRATESLRPPREGETR